MGSCVRVTVVVTLVLLGKMFTVSRVTLVSTHGDDLSGSVHRKDSATHVTLGLTGSPSGFLSAVRVKVALVNVLANVCSNSILTASFKGVLASTNMPTACTCLLTRALVIVLIACLAVVFNRLIPGHVNVDTSAHTTGLLTHPVC